MLCGPGREGSSPGPGRDCPKTGCQEIKPASKWPVKPGGWMKSERRNGPLRRSKSRTASTQECHPPSTFGTLLSRFGQATVFGFAQSVNNRQLNPRRNSMLSASSTDCCRKNDTTPSSGQTCKLLQISPSLPLTQLAGESVSFSMEMGGFSSV